MKRVIQKLLTGTATGWPGAGLRLFATLVLVIQIVYTPFHLYHVRHAGETDGQAHAEGRHAAEVTSHADQDGDGHQEHSAAQHKLKALRSERAAAAAMVLVPLAEWVDARPAYPQPQLFEFSGLSPPELSRCWQFFFRAALPVRAPSTVS